jgi:Holliday junction resolvasome RuvABC DNA-binding subunit
MPHVATMRSSEPSNYEWTVKKTEIIAAMKQMGFSKEEARALVEQAAGELPRNTSREELLRRALHIYRHSAAGASLAR